MTDPIRHQGLVTVASFMRSTPYLQSHTPLTAIQGIAALILAYAVLKDYRVDAASVREAGVLGISFLKTLHMVFKDCGNFRNYRPTC